jgi:phosphodiesterase/alkaline phosphatase D-like protein
MIFGPRRGTTTSQTFWAVDSAYDGTLGAGGTLGVSVYQNGAEIPGSPFSGDTLAAGTNMTGTVTATGLTARTQYTYQMRLAGADVAGKAGKFTTKPAAGQDADLMFIVCAAEAHPCYAKLYGEFAHAVFNSESGYLDSQGSGFDYASAPAPLTSALPLVGTETTTSSYMTSDDFLAWRDAFRLRHRGVLSLRQTTQINKWKRMFYRNHPMRFGWDNHEMKTSAGSTVTAPGQSRFDGAMRAAWEYYFQGNPDHAHVTDPSLSNDALPTRDGTNFFATYFAETIGDVEVIVTDHMAYSDMTASLDAIRTFDNAGRGGNDQFTWLKARITASTAKFLIIFAPRGYQIGAGEWENTSTGLLAALGNKNQTIVVVSGDLHRPFARTITKTSAAGATLTRPVFEVGPGALRAISVKTLDDITGGQTVHHNPVGGANTAFDGVYTAAGRDACTWSYLKVESRPNAPGGALLALKLTNPLTGVVNYSANIREGNRVP